MSGWPSKCVAHASFSAAVGSGRPAATLAAIVATASGVASTLPCPIIAAAAMALSSLSVIVNSALLKRARIAAARDGKSVSRFVAEAVEQRVGRPLSQREALERFLAGPPLHVLDENGKAPTHDQMYADD